MVMVSNRANRVSDLILREIADLLMRKVKDPRVKGITLTGALVSKDLRHAKVYFSVMGGEEEIRRAQVGLDSARGFIKREIGLRMDLKYVPEILFKHDPSLEKGSEMERLFQKIKEDERSTFDE
jgi:ribosome-binding factor A